jgi:sigma-B regulation protein RsbU (phosphoserine phosphatase)
VPSSDDSSSRPGPTEDLEDLYENAPCGYLSLHPDGRVFKVNATFCRWVGFTPEELAGKRLHDLLNIAGRIFYETHFAPLLRMQGYFNEVALDFVTRQGERLPVLVNAAEKRDTDERHLFTRLTVFNAVDRRRYERELLEAKAAADAARQELEKLHAKLQASLLDERATSALREQFIAVLGHDLRNPLMAIAAGAAMLLRRPDRTTDIVARIQQSAARMAGLINDVLDFARGRLGGGLTLERGTSEPVGAALYQVIEELRATHPERAVEVEFSLAEIVHCDRARIAQLFSNLLGNAMTHGAPTIPIRVRATTGVDVFELSVANGGEPISPAAMERLFEPFFRGSIRPSQQGLGLGLYIASEIARAHGGALEATSNSTETRFTFRMPLGVPPPVDADAIKRGS